MAAVQAESPVLAFVTTIHCALVVLRKYRPRGNGNLALLPSIFFVVSPWILSSFLWLAIGFAAHIAWFIACEKLLAQPAAKPVASRPARLRAAAPIAPAVEPRIEAAAERQPSLAPAPAPRKGFQQLPVYAVITETPEIRTFRFARPAGFTFKPGQFVSVKVEIDGKPIVRCYSISSSPSVGGYLEISVRNQGKVSGLLHATIRPGSTLNVGGPGGGFVYPDDGRPIVLLAGGIGVTPLLSMLRHALDFEPNRPVTLILSSKSEKLLPFAEQLRLLARRHPHFRLAVALSGGSDTSEFHSGRIDQNVLQTVVEHLRESVYMICGPQPMVDEMKRILASLEVLPGQIHSEKFEPAATGAAAAAAKETPAAAAAAHDLPAQAASRQALRVTLRKQGRAVEVRHGQTILEAAEEAGAEIQSMCRGGICGTCRVKLLHGEADGNFGSLAAADRAEGYVLACTARPVSDCVIDA